MKVFAKTKNCNPYLFHNSKKNRLILSIAVILVFGIIANRISQLMEQMTEEQPCSALASMIGTNGEMSVGYDTGEILSIDGMPIAEKYASSPGGWTKLCGIPGYNGVLGSAGSGGAISAWQDVLLSSASEVNRMSRTGDTIQTTLSSTGQTTAAKLLADSFPQSVCDSACLSIVLRDGAVLVAAGSNSCTPADYFNESRLKRIHDNYAVEPFQVGSVAKGVMARVLQLHDSDLPAEWSIYNQKFLDISYYATGKGIIHNHDHNSAGSYDGIDENGLRYRIVSLFEALFHSSNTYFLRHMLQLGGAKQAYRTVCDTFGLLSPIQTEIGVLEPVTCGEERLPYFFFGQDFVTSSTRLAQIYNNAISGEAYAPFFVSAVYLPDRTEIYRAQPSPRKDLTFQVDKENDIVREGLAKCMQEYSIDRSVTAPYQTLIDEGRLLTKSGTADTVESAGKTNATRVLTVLDENREVICTAAIIAHNVKPGALNGTMLYKVMFDTLSSCGILEPKSS